MRFVVAFMLQVFATLLSFVFVHAKHCSCCCVCNGLHLENVQLRVSTLTLMYCSA